jgi:dephospho-CoA kinase
MIIGITGSFGSGKTTVAKMFGKLGAYIIDADKVCHSLMLPSGDVYKRIVRRFGKSVLGKNGAIDRKKMGGLVFEERSKTVALNRIVHPHAIKEIKRLIDLNKRKKIIVVDAPLLIESGLYKKMDKLIVVKNDTDRQIYRLARAKGMDKEEALKRIRMQEPFRKKAALADFVIDNRGSKKETLFQVREIWKKL